MTRTLDTASDATWHRLSPRMLLVHPIVEVGRSIPALLGAFLAGQSTGTGPLWGLVGTAIVVTLAVSRWFTTRLRIAPDQVQLRRGLIRRATVAAPIDRVRTVDVTSHLLHRVLGLARVVIGTGTSDRRGRRDLVLDGLTVETAQQLRADLLHRSPVTPSVQPETPPAEYELARLDPSWVRFAPFTLSGAVTGLVLYGFAARLNEDAHINVLRSGPVRSLSDALRHVPVAVDVLFIGVAVAVFVAVTSTVGYVLAFWDFRLTRHMGGTLHVTRGLLTSRATSIERRRLAGVEISDTLLTRVVGGARCLAIATGLRAGRGAERGGTVLLPPAPRGVALGVASWVLDGTAAFAAPLVEHGRYARRRRVIRACVGALALAGLATVPFLTGHGPVLLAVGALPLVAAVPLALDRYRNLGHALVDDYVVTRFGSLVRRHSVVSRDAVIGWNLRSTFFQRRLGLATLTATTAAGKQRYGIFDVDVADAVRFADAAVPGLLTEFLA